MNKKNTFIPSMTFEEAKEELESCVAEYAGASHSLDPKNLAIPLPPETREHEGSAKERAARTIREILERYPSLHKSAPSELWPENCFNADEPNV